MPGGRAPAGGLRHCAQVAGEEQRRVGEPELDPGQHQALPRVQAAHREELGVHAHDLRAVQVRLLLDVQR